MYTPQPDDEGIQLLTAALRDYVRSEPGIISLLPAGNGGVIPEGFMTNETPTPIILIADLGYGESASGDDVRLQRYIVYVLDRGRGYFYIDKGLTRLGKLFNNTQRALDFLTFPAEEPLKVLTIRAPGATATASFPQWTCEGKGLYLFVEVRGLDASE